MISNTAVLAMAMCLTGAGIAAQQPITKHASISATATIQAIDATARTITLRDASGQDDTYSVGPEVKRFDELKVGDTVKMTYHEAIVLQVRKPGEKGASMSTNAAIGASTGALPGAAAGVQDKVTVTV